MNPRVMNIPDEPWAKWLKFAAALAVPPLLAWIAHLEIRQDSLEGRLRTVETSQWTSRDEARWQSGHQDAHLEIIKVLGGKVDPEDVQGDLIQIREDLREVRALLIGLRVDKNGE